LERNNRASWISRAWFVDTRRLDEQVTGLDAKDTVVALICRTFEMLKSFADFEQKITSPKPEESAEASGRSLLATRRAGTDDEVDLRLSYSINLVLPKTDDPAVFNAIFKAVREHLLRK
jgi:hypothetical protein